MGRGLIGLIAVWVACQAIGGVPQQSALAAAAVAQANADKAWPSQAYRVDWEEAHVPAEAAAHVTLAVPVIVRNIGNRAWPASQVFVSYHLLRDGRHAVWDGERTRLPRDLGAGGRTAVSVRVKTPSDPGSYVLQITLVHELVTWFENKGATMIVRPIVVRPPTQLVDRSAGPRGAQP